MGTPSPDLFARPSTGLSQGRSAKSSLLLLPLLLLLLRLSQLLLSLQSLLLLSQFLLLPSLLLSTLLPSLLLEPTRAPSMPMELASPSADVTSKSPLESAIFTAKNRKVT